MQFLLSAPVYVVLYVLVMIPTYVLPYLGSNSLAVVAAQSSAPQGTTLLTWVHLAAMLILMAFAWFRGALIDKKWLVVFPFLALVFDFVPGLNWIPFVPTVMHLLAVILGVVGVKAMTPVAQRA